MALYANILFPKEQLQRSKDLLEVIDKLHLNTAPAILLTTLERTRSTVAELDKFIRDDLLRHTNGKSKARRRAWATNKTRVRELRDTLKENREFLHAAMSAVTS